MNRAETAVDQHLDATTIRLLTWKPGVMRNIAIQITQLFAENGAPQFPDAFDFDWVPEADRNGIGIAFRLLTGAGIISKTGQYRRSTATRANGRTVWSYRLESMARARTFLRQNGVTPASPQLVLL